MKKNRLPSSILILSLGLTLSSCSFLSRRSPFDDDGEEKKPNITGDMVPKEQFDQLTLKYENLLRKNEELEGRLKIVAGGEVRNSSEDISPENLAATIRDADTSLTVDAFAHDEIAPVSPSVESGFIDPDLFNKELDKLKKANALLVEAKYDLALKDLKELEQSKHLQIKVRAKYSIGELLFRQQEYDLAMQVFDEIISKEAYSGLVIRTLGRLVVCAEKLKLRDKHELYQTLLQNFFDEG